MIVRADHLGGMKFRLETPVNTLIADQWEDFGGDGEGPMPSEFMLCAVAACFGQAVLHVASRMRKELEGLRLEVDGEKDVKLFRLSRVAIRVISDIPDEELSKVVATAKKYCFITNSLSSDVEVAIAVGAA